jgi:hypothetical protein
MQTQVEVLNNVSKTKPPQEPRPNKRQKENQKRKKKKKKKRVAPAKTTALQTSKNSKIAR